MQRTEIAFIDDTDFYSNKNNYNENMQKIMDKYTALHKTIGGRI